MDENISITELPNELTWDIDIADEVGIVRIFRQTDVQMFNGWQTYSALYDQEIIQKIAQAVERTARTLADPQPRVVISGAGTSGRLAMFAARTFNRILKERGREPIFRYLIAGGNKALIKAQEGAEDDPYQAVKELKLMTRGARKVAYFGVTCGFSAAYVAGQLDYARNKSNYFSVLLGFNPIERARAAAIEGWHRTFRIVAQEVAKSPNCLLLNPIVGPEPITGSTRMKGGSATKLLLEIVFTLGLIRAGVIKPAELQYPLFETNWPLQEQVRAFLQQYEETRVCTYEELEAIAGMVKCAGQSLRNNGHIYYLGAPPTGILGTIDASECPPTFGAGFDDVRGFIQGGWPALLDEPSADLTHSLSAEEARYYHIDLKKFKIAILPSLSRYDLVIAIGESQQPIRPFHPLLKEAKARGATTAAVVPDFSGRRVGFIDHYLVPCISVSGLLSGHPFFSELAIKFMLNAVTTGAHIIKGKVYENRMVDLRISNNKLYYRTIRIVSKIMGVNEKRARQSVLRAIYGLDRLNSRILRAPVSRHVSAATDQEKVVPTALLLATGRFTYDQARQLLKKQPIVRNIIANLPARKA